MTETINLCGSKAELSLSNVYIVTVGTDKVAYNRVDTHPDYCLDLIYSASASLKSILIAYEALQGDLGGLV